MKTYTEGQFWSALKKTADDYQKVIENKSREVTRLNKKIYTAHKALKVNNMQEAFSRHDPML